MSRRTLNTCFLFLNGNSVLYSDLILRFYMVHYCDTSRIVLKFTCIVNSPQSRTKSHFKSRVCWKQQKSLTIFFFLEKALRLFFFSLNSITYQNKFYSRLENKSMVSQLELMGSIRKRYSIIRVNRRGNDAIKNIKQGQFINSQY